MSGDFYTDFLFENETLHLIIVLLLVCALIFILMRFAGFSNPIVIIITICFMFIYLYYEELISGVIFSIALLVLAVSIFVVYQGSANKTILRSED